MAFQAYPFNGNLRSNEIFSAIYNMIISQQVFADNLKHNYQLVEKFRVDGNKYGDTKLYYATDALPTNDWLNDAEASNLLALARPNAPAVQAVTVSNFRQIRLTVDDYLSARAWSDEGAFSSFTSVMTGWLEDTKKMYEARKFNCYIGGTQTTTGKQKVTVPVATATSGLTGEEKARVKAATIADTIANVIDEVMDYSRSYNDLGYMRSFNPEDFYLIWNAQVQNEIKKTSLPTMYHNDLFDKIEEVKLPAAYFNIPLTSSNVATYKNSSAAGAAGKPIGSDNIYYPGTNNANGKIISLIEQTITVSSTNYHVYPGDEIPSGASLATLATTANEGHPAEAKFGIVDATVACKLVHKNAIPFMSAFSVGTNFFNPRSLTETKFLTWGHSDLVYLKNYPFITVVIG